jgi:cell division initiation protein
MMTVEAIANKSFRRTFLGYDLEQVDDFLDEIIRQMQQMEQERRELTDTIDYLVGELRNAGIVPMDRELEHVAQPVSPHAAFIEEGEEDE